MISIIIPACNEEKYLKETINSVKNQGYKHEIIVVCDGCTDKTAETAKSLADKFVILKERHGPAFAKNEGEKMAAYNKLVFLDADTKLTENVLKEISEALDRGYVGTCRIKPSDPKFKHKTMMFLKNLYPFPYTNGILFCTREAFRKVKGFPEVKKGEERNILKQLAEDFEFKVIKNPVISSTRRFDKKGYFNVMFYWIKEYFKPSDEDYEVIR